MPGRRPGNSRPSCVPITRVGETAPGGHLVGTYACDLVGTWWARTCRSSAALIGRVRHLRPALSSQNGTVRQSLVFFDRGWQGTANAVWVLPIRGSNPEPPQLTGPLPFSGEGAAFVVRASSCSWAHAQPQSAWSMRSLASFIWSVATCSAPWWSPSCGQGPLGRRGCVRPARSAAWPPCAWRHQGGACGAAGPASAPGSAVDGPPRRTPGHTSRLHRYSLLTRYRYADIRREP
jgi:hypothetical protein